MGLQTAITTYGCAFAREILVDETRTEAVVFAAQRGFLEIPSKG
jgi:hypothetical protein